MFYANLSNFGEKLSALEVFLPEINGHFKIMNIMYIVDLGRRTNLVSSLNF